MSSTKLTNHSTRLAMVDSHSLKLAFSLARSHSTLATYVSRQLVARGHTTASPSVLNFLSELECGINHAAEIARRLGVSRQMVSKTVNELCKCGLLQLAVDPERKNQKIITFTQSGEHLMADARQILAALDNRLGKDRMIELIDGLEKIQTELEALN